MACTNSQVARHRVQRVVPNWSPDDLQLSEQSSALVLVAGAKLFDLVGGQPTQFGQRLGRHSQLEAFGDAVVQVGRGLLDQKMGPGFAKS
jgi:hypothetical protein